MWIETPCGEIVDAEKVFAFGIDATDNTSIFAVSEIGGKRFALCGYNNTTEAKTALKQISEGLAKGEKVLVLK